MSFKYTRAPFIRRESRQPLPRLFPRFREYAQPVIEMRSSCIGTQADISHIYILMFREIFRIQIRQRLQCLVSFGGQRQQMQRPLKFRVSHYHLPLTPCHPRPFLNHNMGIGSAETEGADACKSGVVFQRPGDLFDWHFHWKFIPGNMRIRRFEMQVRRNFFILERKHHLEQTRHSSTRFKMPHVGFHRTDDQRIILRTIFAEHGTECADFYGISQGCPSAVRFDIADLRRIHVSACQCLSDDSFLGRAAGNGQSAAGSVMVHG